MAINLVKLENDLKNAPDQAIVGYVQNPSGQVPTYLALAELERRKRMRQGAMASQGGEQPSVADQLVAESQPQPQMGGIADIPVQNVGNEESYAAGGIVAFEDGGEVQRFNERGFVKLSPEQLKKLTPQQLSEYYRNALAYGEAKSMLGAAAMDPAAYGFTTYADRMREESGLQSLAPKKESAAVAAIPNEFAPQTQVQPQVQPQQPQTGGVNAPPRGPSMGISGLPTWESPKLNEYEVAPYEALRGEKPTQEGVMSLMEAERASRGIAADPYAPLIKDIQAEKGQLKDQFKQDAWMRLAEFGATLASTPGSFGAAIGEAGKKVIPNVIADKKEYKKVERELNKEVNQMALAREGMLEARMKGDMDKYDREQDRYTQAETKVLDMRNKNVDLFNAAAMKGAEKSFEAKMEGFKESQATGRTSMQVAAQDRATSETRKQAVARSMLETAMKPILAGLKQQMVDDETAYAEAFDQALRKLPKDMQAVLGYAPQEPTKGSTIRFDAKGNPIK